MSGSACHCPRRTFQIDFRRVHVALPVCRWQQASARDVDRMCHLHEPLECCGLRSASFAALGGLCGALIHSFHCTAFTRSHCGELMRSAEPEPLSLAALDHRAITLTVLSRCLSDCGPIGPALQVIHGLLCSQDQRIPLVAQGGVLLPGPQLYAVRWAGGGGASGGSCSVTCNCGHSFCFACKEEPHSPARIFAC